MLSSVLGYEPPSARKAGYGRLPLLPPSTAIGAVVAGSGGLTPMETAGPATVRAPGHQSKIRVSTAQQQAGGNGRSGLVGKAGGVGKASGVGKAGGAGKAGGTGRTSGVGKAGGAGNVEGGTKACTPKTLHDDSVEGCYTWCDRAVALNASVCQRCKCAACLACRLHRWGTGSPRRRQNPDAVLGEQIIALGATSSGSGASSAIGNGITTGISTGKFSLAEWSYPT